jgi:hypothetical protein
LPATSRRGEDSEGWGRCHSPRHLCRFLLVHFAEAPGSVATGATTQAGRAIAGTPAAAGILRGNASATTHASSVTTPMAAFTGTRLLASALAKRSYPTGDAAVMPRFSSRPRTDTPIAPPSARNMMGMAVAMPLSSPHFVPEAHGDVARCAEAASTWISAASARGTPRCSRWSFRGSR